MVSDRQAQVDDEKAWTHNGETPRPINRSAGFGNWHPESAMDF